MAEHKATPLDPEAAERRVKVGDRELVVRPLSLKRIRELARVVAEKMGGISEKVAGRTNDEAIGIATQSWAEVARCAFKEDFLTDEFVEENFTVPLARHLIGLVIDVNNLDAIYPALAAWKPAKATATPGA